MCSFEKAYKKTIVHEGFYANVEGDIGGETYMGVSRYYHPDWEGWPIVDAEKEKQGGRLPWNYRIRNSRLEQLVQAFYKKAFWDHPGFGRIYDEALAIQLFDFYVNARHHAVKVIQKVLNEDFGEGLAVDGISGPKTIGAINRAFAEMLFECFKEARMKYYQRIAQRGQNQKFLKGWMKRAKSYEYIA
ncbi:glycoside hydrolase family 108 protein [Algivirga pacifica]|uniref:Peptidoglycan domain protein n=1 Tax=Algivirga pacifica TaxID=1162670 RepID=A0ABP9DSZ3_9BACT